MILEGFSSFPMKIINNENWKKCSIYQNKLTCMQRGLKYLQQVFYKNYINSSEPLESLFYTGFLYNFLPSLTAKDIFEFLFNI